MGPLKSLTLEHVSRTKTAWGVSLIGFKGRSYSPKASPATGSVGKAIQPTET